MIDRNVPQKLSWRLAELAGATGLSLGFLRKEAYAGRLPTRKIGAAVIVLAEDVKMYLAGDSQDDAGNPGQEIDTAAEQAAAV